MLLRDDDRGVLVIGQTSHAWLSGQLARAWGNSRFPAPAPREEVCLAAEQHDVGMSLWDLEPTFNPRTGLPHSFLEMPLATHLALWSAAPRRLLTQSRYAALLVSMHGSRLYRRRELDTLDEADAAAIRAYLTAQDRFQEELSASLARDTLTAASAREETVARNSQLLWTWDALSLAICLGEPSGSVSAVPMNDDNSEVRLSAIQNQHRLRLEPWPFADEAVFVHCEGRRLEHHSEDERTLHAALAEAPWETLRVELVAG